MKLNWVWTLCVVFIVCGLAACPYMPGRGSQAMTIWGRVDVDVPVVGAAVLVQDADSGVSLWQGVAANGHFLGHESVDMFPAAGKDLLFTASGGTVASTPFTGTLQAYVPAYTTNDHIEINLLTTLIAAYMQTWMVQYERARQEVFDYLKLPRDFDLLDVAHQANSRLCFDPARFLERASAFGGIDEYVHDLAANEIGIAEGRSYGALYSADEAGVKLSASEMGAALGRSIMSAIGTKAAGLVLSYFGFQGTDDQLADINTKLDTMNTKLDSIASDLATLQSSVEATLAAVNLSRDQIISQIAGYDIAGPQSIIKNQYTNLTDSYATDSPGIHTAQGQHSAYVYSEDILAASGYDIDQKLADLNDGIIGATVGTKGFLDAVTDVAIDQVADGTDILDAYMVMESYFSELLAIQGKGLILMTEALNFEQAYPSAGASKRFTGTADQFLAKFQGYMVQQVEKFLSCVDRLAVSKFNIVTDLAVPVQVVPDNTGTVYQRADFLAHLMSPLNHPAGLILRVIGTPTDVRNLVTAGPYVKDVTSWVFCDYKAASPAKDDLDPDDPDDPDFPDTGDDCPGSSFTATTVTPFASVNVNSNPINLYPANLPSDHTLGKYYEWSFASGTITCRLQSQISVAKLSLGTGGNTTTSSNDCVACDPSAGGGTDESWSVEPGLQAPISGSPYQLTQYDDSFNKTTSGTSYANVLVVLRNLPPSSAWTTTPTWLTASGGNQMSAAFDLNSLKVTTAIALTNLSYYSDPWDPSDTYYYWPVDCGIVTSAKISPATAADVSGKLCVSADAALSYTTSYSNTIGLNGTLSQWTALDTKTTPTTKHNVVYSANAYTVDTGSAAVSEALVSGVATPVSICQQIVDGTGFRARGPFNLGACVAYWHFRIYPVSQ